MAEIITQIPGYESGRVQYISAADEVSVSFFVARMAEGLRKKWNTTVLCISLDGNKEAIEKLLPNDESFGRVIVINQKNPNIQIVVNKAIGIINRRFARAVIISGAERLVHSGSSNEEIVRVERQLSILAKRKGIPVILVDTKNN